jgi:hypothetical protein
MRENALIVVSLLKRVTTLLTRSRDPSPLLRHRSVYSCCLATNEARPGATRLGSAWRKHRFVYFCLIVGACFDVTVLAWRKYATIWFCLSSFNGCNVANNDARHLWYMLLKWSHMAWYTYDAPWRSIQVTIWKDIMLVLLTEGIYEVHRWDDIMWYYTVEYLLHARIFEPQK